MRIDSAIKAGKELYNENIKTNCGLLPLWSYEPKAKLAWEGAVKLGERVNQINSSKNVIYLNQSIKIIQTFSVDSTEVNYEIEKIK